MYKNYIYLNDLKIAAESIIDFKKMFNKSIMITGATGLIGSFIVDVLMFANKEYNANITIYATGRSKERLKKRFSLYKDKKLFFIEHDVNNEIKYDFNLDYIIHAASNAYPEAFSIDPVGTMMSNIIGTKNLLEYSRSHGVSRFLFISSGEIYGQIESEIESFEENCSGYVNILEARSCYPMSKRAAETLCISYTKQYKLDTVIVRPCHSFGPNITSKDNRANVQFMKNVINDEDIVLKSSGNQYRSYCYVADSVSAILTVLLNGKSCEAYNIANSKNNVTVAEFANKVASVSGKKVIFENPTDFEKDQQTPIQRQILDSRKIESLGWKGKYSIESGIENTIKILTS